MNVKKLKKIVAYLLVLVMLVVIYQPTFKSYAVAIDDETVSNEIIEANLSNYTLEQLPDSYTEVKNSKEITGIDKDDASILTSFTTINKDGSRTLRIYDEPIKYYDDKTKEIKFIDNSLKKSSKKRGKKTYSYENKLNNVKTYFPSDLSDGVAIEVEDYSVELTPLIDSSDSGKKKINKKSEYKKCKNTDYAHYEKAFGENTELQYTPTFKGIKENIILKEYNKQHKYYFELKTKGLVPEQLKGKTINFVDQKSGEKKFTIEETFLVDSYEYGSNEKLDKAAHITYNNYYTVEETAKNTYILTTIVDDKFLKAKTTVYPVTIDPLISYADIEYSNISIANVFSDTGRNNTDTVVLGNHSSRGSDGRAYVKTDVIKNYKYINPSLIQNASLELENIRKGDNITVNAYTTNFSKSMGTVTYDDCKDNIVKRISTQVFDDDFENSVNITYSVKKWLKYALEESDTETHEEKYGLVLAASNNDDEYTEFGSPSNSLAGKRPNISISYYNDSSIEDTVYLIKNVATGEYLSLDGGATQVVTSDYSEANALRWRISTYQTTTGTKIYGLYEIHSMVNTNKCLNNDGTDVVVSNGNDSQSQRWRLIKNSDGTYRLMSIGANNDDSSVIADVDTINKALSLDWLNQVEMHNYKANEKQKWELISYDRKHKSYKLSIKNPSDWPEDKAATSENLVYNTTPDFKYGTTLKSGISGYEAADYSGKSTITNGIITDGNMNVNTCGLKQYDTSSSSYKVMRFIKPNAKYRKIGQLYLDITFDLGSNVELSELWFATNTADGYYKVGAYEVYISYSRNNLYCSDNKYVKFDNHDEKWSGVTKLKFNDDKSGRYIGIRITQGVLQRPETSPWTMEEVAKDIAYVRMRGIAVFGERISWNGKKHETYEIDVDEWPESRATTSQNLVYNKIPSFMYGTTLTKGIKDTESVTTGGKTSITNGIITDGNMNINGCNIRDNNICLRFINPDTSYRDIGELYLDITLDMGANKTIGELWLATNTENSYYKTGVYEIYLSDTLSGLYADDNFYTIIDKHKEKWSGITKTVFDSGITARYIGIRITQGVLKRPSSSPWTIEETEKNIGYVRMRGVAVFSHTQAEGITVSKTSTSISSRSGGTKQLKAYLSPSNATNIVNWKSSNPKIATVDQNGKVTARNSGVVTITASASRYSASCKITIYAAPIPTSATSGVSNGAIYRIRNSGNGKLLEINNGETSNGTKAVLSSRNNKHTYQKFKISYYKDGMYKIIPKHTTGKVLSLNSDNEVVINSDNGSSNNYWYIISRSSGGYYIINYSNKTAWINNASTDAAANYTNSYTGAVWYLDEGFNITVKNYFDNGMLTRWNATQSQMSGTNGIGHYTSLAKEFFEGLTYKGLNIGIKLSFANTVLKKSLPDECNNAYATIEELQCNCNHTDSHDIRANIYDSLDSSENIPVLWTGHIIFGDNEERTNSGSRFPLNIVDGKILYSKVIMENVGSSKLEQKNFSSFNDDTMRAHRTYLHELSHCFGTKDSYCTAKNDSDTCTNILCSMHNAENGYDKYCIMSELHPYTTTKCDKTIYDLDMNKWLCDKCKQDIDDYLYKYY